MAAVLGEAAADEALVGAGRVIAVGWATVELDRAAAELAADLGSVAGAFAPAADSVALGARCRVMPAALPGRVAVAIVEPATEGRLAGSLARYGEGPVAVWFAAGPALADKADGASDGPFGPERLALQRISIATRCWLLIARAPGTIDA
jgi:hypothetical protein